MDFPETSFAILPPQSRSKLERLISDRELAHAALRSASDVMQEARRDYYLAEAAARERLEMPQGYDLHHPAAALALPTKAEIAERNATEARLLAPVETAKRRRDLAVDAHERATAQWQKFAFLDGARQWLDRAAALGIGHLEHHAPHAPKSKDAAAEVARLRNELVALDETWAAAEAAPAPAADLRDRFLTELDQIAAHGRPTVYPETRAGSPVALAEQIQIAAVPIGDATRLTGDAGASFFCWLMRDEIAAKVGNLIDAAPQDGALTDDEREREFRRISTRRLEIERAEESLICLAAVEGRTIPRRRDVDPRAILEVAEV